MYLVIVIFSIVLFAVTRHQIYSTELHNDEISWFYHTEFFEQAFIKHDASSPRWESYESYDHPQLSKYIYGAYLWYRYPSILTVRTRLQNTYGRWQFYFRSDIASIRNHVFAPYLYAMREANYIFFLGLLLLIGITIYMVTLNMVLPVLGIMLLLQNKLFVDSTIRATSDAQVIFFMYASLLLYILYKQKKSLVVLVGSGLCAGFAGSAKITGVLILYTLITNEVMCWFLGYGKAYALRTIGVLIGLSMFIWIALNPGLYADPIWGTVRYFDFRIAQSARLQAAFPEIALMGVHSRIHTMYCTVLDPSCSGAFYHGALFPVAWLNILAVVFGIILLVERGKINKYRERIMSISLYMVIVVFIITFLLVLNSDRYFILVQINVWLAELFGVYWVFVHGAREIRALIMRR